MDCHEKDMTLRRMLLLLVAVLSACHLSRCQDSMTLLPGNVTLAAMFSVNDFDKNGCGRFEVGSLKDVVAVTWFLRAINEMNYVPGVTIGLEAFRACQSSEIAAKGAANILDKYNVLENVTGGDNDPAPLLGVLGPETTEEAMTVSQILGSMPEKRRLVQISGTATGEALSDKTAYPNFFRVIPPDSTQVQVLAELLEQLKWNYVAIVFSDDAYGRQAADKLRSLAHYRDICVPVFGALPLDTRDQSFSDFVRNIGDQIDGGDKSLVKGVVFIGESVAAQRFIDIIKGQINFVRFVFTEAIGLQSSALTGSANQPYAIAKGALAASPPNLPLQEFQDYWTDLWSNMTVFLEEAGNNEWLAAFYTQVTNCQIRDEGCWTRNLGNKQLLGSTDQYLFQYYQVKAVAFFAALLKQLHKDHCGQASGLCSDLETILKDDKAKIQEKLQNLVVQGNDFASIITALAGQTFSGFDNRGEAVITPGSSHYGIYNYRRCQGNKFCFRQVGNLSASGTLTLKTAEIEGYDKSGSPLQWPNFTTSQCQDGYDCLECVPENLPGQVVFVPGDFYLVAVAPVHDREGGDALHCGRMRSLSSADLVQSVLFAVQQVNAKTREFAGIFGNKKLGVLILDSCYRELVIKERLLALHRGTLDLPDGRKSSAILNNIAGYVGGYFSTISVAVYEVLSKLEKRFVMVGPSNTSPVLSDRTVFPYYLRVSTSTHKLVKAMLSLVRELGSHYVQVIYDPGDVYSETLKTALDSVGPTYNVCIAQSIVSRYEAQNQQRVLEDMRKASSASIVIVTLVVDHVRQLLNDVLDNVDSSDNFVFLASEAWGRREQVLEVKGSGKLVGSLTFTLELPVNLRFNDYFEHVDPLNTPNIWLKYFLENRKNCYFDGSFLRKGKTGLCPGNVTTGFPQDPWAPFYINSVYAFAKGLDAAMTEYCGTEANYLCDELTSERMANSMKTVNLDMLNSGQATNVFDDNGDGTLGFRVFQVSRGATEDALVYKQVGRYDYDKLTLSDRNNLWIIKNGLKAVCPNGQACKKCFSSKTSSAGTSQLTTGSKEDNPTWLMYVIAGLGVVVLVLILIVVVVKGRRQRSRSRGAKKNARSAFGSLAKGLGDPMNESPHSRNAADLISLSSSCNASAAQLRYVNVDDPSAFSASSSPPAFYLPDTPSDPRKQASQRASDHDYSTLDAVHESAASIHPSASAPGSLPLVALSASGERFKEASGFKEKGDYARYIDTGGAARGADYLTPVHEGDNV